MNPISIPVNKSRQLALEFWYKAPRDSIKMYIFTLWVLGGVWESPSHCWGLLMLPTVLWTEHSWTHHWCGWRNESRIPPSPSDGAWGWNILLVSAGPEMRPAAWMAHEVLCILCCETCRMEHLPNFCILVFSQYTRFHLRVLSVMHCFS